MQESAGECVVKFSLFRRVKVDIAKLPLTVDGDRVLPVGVTEQALPAWLP